MHSSFRVAAVLILGLLVGPGCTFFAEPAAANRNPNPSFMIGPVGATRPIILGHTSLIDAVDAIFIAQRGVRTSGAPVLWVPRDGERRELLITYSEPGYFHTPIFVLGDLYLPLPVITVIRTNDNTLALEYNQDMIVTGWRHDLTPGPSEYSYLPQDDYAVLFGPQGAARLRQNGPYDPPDQPAHQTP